MKFNYNPTGFYRKAFDTEFGRALWKFLTHRDQIIVMATCDRVYRPALDGLTGPLVDEFGDKVWDDMLKKLAGNMVGAIQRQRGMDIGGYTKCRDARIFGRATIWMPEGEVAKKLEEEESEEA